MLAPCTLYGTAYDGGMTTTKKNFSIQLEKARIRLNMSKTALAKKLGTSRSQLARILDPAENAITLDLLLRAAAAVGLKLKISFEDPKTKKK